MSREPRKPSGIVVKKVDITEFLDLVKKGLLDRKSPCVEVTARDVAYIETKKGMYVINSEGVGDSRFITYINPFYMDLYVTKEENTIPVMPDMVQPVRPDSFKALPYVEVLLEDFIRKFGYRLEENYTIWVDAINKANA